MNVVRLFLDPNGRIGREVYWLAVALLTSALILLAQTPLDISGGASWLVMAPFMALWKLRPETLRLLADTEVIVAASFVFLGLCVYGKRLHDLGATAWIYAGALVCLPVVIVVAGIAAGFYAGMQGQSGDPRLAQGFAFGVAPLAMPTAWLVFSIVLGVCPGERHANRYGPPPANAPA